MNERRQAPRIKLQSRVMGRVRGSATVDILDISSGGMLVRSQSPLPPARELTAWLPTNAGEVEVHAQVLRCRARTAKLPDSGRAVLVYYAALAFVGLGSEQQRALESTFLLGSSDPDAAEPSASEASPPEVQSRGA